MKTLDPIDARILHVLQAEGRISNLELADRVALTSTPCARRVALLERAGVIRDYVALLEPRTLSLTVNAFVELRLVRERASEAEQFERAIALLPEVMECHVMSGAYDYLLRVVATDLESYHLFLRERLMLLPGVERVQTSFALASIVSRSALPLAQAIRR